MPESIPQMTGDSDWDWDLAANSALQVKARYPSSFDSSGMGSHNTTSWGPASAFVKRAGRNDATESVPANAKASAADPG